MAEKLRAVHYINQFFAQMGGEESASVGISTREGPVGPGLGLKAALGDRAEIVATIVCGDNHIAENIESVTDEVVSIIESYKPDLFFAGPAFNAGRYGVACGALCAAVKKRLGIPAVTALFEENPGREIYASDICILRSGDNARKMAAETKKMAEFALKLYDNTLELDPDKEGFFERGWMIPSYSDKSAASRSVDMLLAKLSGEPFKTEIPLPHSEKAECPPPVADLKKAKILLATDGGLCPTGNPDNMRTGSSVVFNSYSVEGKDRLSADEYTCVHGGFDRTYVLEDPNRLVPLDAMRILEKEGVTTVHNEFASTSGLTTSIAASTVIGKSLVEYVRNHNIDAVILTST